MKCPKCKKYELEISKADLNLGRNGLRVWVACSDNVCLFSKVLELGFDDIIAIGRDPETEAETRAAIARAMKKDKESNCGAPNTYPIDDKRPPMVDWTGRTRHGKEQEYYGRSRETVKRKKRNDLEINWLCYMLHEQGGDGDGVCTPERA